MSRAEIRATARQREARAVQLRTAGATYQQIGDRLGCSESRAWRIVQRALDRMVREPADQLRQLELARLDQLWIEATKVLHRSHITVSNGRVALDPRTGQPLEDDGPVLQAIDRLLKIMERRARLLGLDAPTRVNVITEDMLDAEIARLEAELRGLEADG
jgi:Homeodomain-like domain